MIAHPIDMSGRLLVSARSLTYATEAANSTCYLLWDRTLFSQRFRTPSDLLFPKVFGGTAIKKSTMHECACLVLQPDFLLTGKHLCHVQHINIPAAIA